MPKQYEAMRDKFAGEGLSYDAAQAKAARIYNSKHPNAPVTGRSEGRRTQRKRQMRRPKSY